MQQQLTTDDQAKQIITKLYATTAIDDIIKRAKIGKQRYAALVRELVSSGEIPEVKPKVSRKHGNGGGGSRPRKISMTNLELFELWTSKRSRAHKVRVMEQTGLKEFAIQARIRRYMEPAEEVKPPCVWVTSQWTDPAFVSDRRTLWGG